MKTNRKILTTLALGVALAFLSRVLPAEAGTYTDPASLTATSGHVDCTTTSGTLLAAADRGMVAFTTTSGSGTVYVTTDATVGSTAAATQNNSFPLGGGVSWTNETRPMYAGAFRCLAKTGTVTIFYYEVK